MPTNVPAPPAGCPSRSRILPALPPTASPLPPRRTLPTSQGPPAGSRAPAPGVSALLFRLAPTTQARSALPEPDNTARAALPAQPFLLVRSVLPHPPAASPADGNGRRPLAVGCWSSVSPSKPSLKAHRR